MRFIISAGLVILLSGCLSTTNNYYTSTMKSWRGGNIQTLAQQWGEPDTKIVNPNGSMIYIYKTQPQGLTTPPLPTPTAVGVNVSRTGRPVIVTPTTPVTPLSPTGVSCLAIFEASPTGKIYNTEIRGQDCYGSLQFSSTMRSPH